MFKNTDWFVVGLIVIIVAIMLTALISTLVMSIEEKEERCQAWCYCQQVGNCSYTFLYDDISECECK